MNEMIVFLNGTGQAVWLRLAAASLELVAFVLLVFAIVRVARLRSAFARLWLWRLSLAKPLVALLIVSPAPFLLAPRTLLPGENAIRQPAGQSMTAGSAGYRTDAERVGPPFREPAATPVGSVTGLDRGGPAGQTADPSAADSSPRSDLPAAGAGSLDPAPQQRAGLSVVGWAILAWLGIVAVLLTRLAVGLFCIWRVRATATRPDPKIEDRAGEAARALQCRPVPVGLSDKIGSPTLAGIFRPMILLPNRIVESLAPDQIRQILIHETAHAKRRDNLFLAGQRFVESLFFFHPLVWLCGIQLRRDTEDACDDIVLRAGGSPARYADSLTRVAELCVDANASWRLTATGAEMNFCRRLTRILEGRAGNSTPLTRTAAACLAALALVGLPSHISHGQSPPGPSSAPAGVIQVQPGDDLQAVIDTAAAGATIRLEAGEYEGFFKIAKPLTLKGAGPSETILFAQFDEFADQPPVLDVRLASLQIEDLRIRTKVPVDKGSTHQYSAVRIDSSRARMRNCAVVGWSGHGVLIQGDSDVEMADCLVAGVWGTGVTVAKTAEPAPRVLLRDSDIRNCHYAGVRIGRGCDEVRILGCRISGAAWHGVRYDHASPTISGNLIFQNARFGIYASGNTEAKIAGNVFYDNEMGGVSCWYYNKDVIERNTFAENEREGLLIVGASEPVVRRNVFFANPVAVTFGYQQGIETAANAPGLIQQNLYWNNEADIAIPPPRNPDETAPTEMQEVALDEESVVADPLFRNTVEGDFALLPRSPALAMNAGAESLPSSHSAWPLQEEEQTIIPDKATRDSREWREPPPVGAVTKAEVPELFGRGGETPYDWQRGTFVPPSPDSFFPYDQEAGQNLAELYRAVDRDRRPDEEILRTFRDGFMATSADHDQLVSWMGNKYIWGESPQHPAAIEIMYHAIHLNKGDPLYFGLSVVKNKSDNILRVLVEIAMKSDDPNVLHRIAWGCASQREAAIGQLRPYLESDDPDTKKKAEAVRGMIAGEIKAFAWAGEQARPRIQEQHKARLPEYKENLLHGDSDTRLEMLRTVPLGLADDSFVEAMLACAEDPDPRVRAELARAAGNRWVWSAPGEQNRRIIRMMMKLGRDTDRQVRYNAVYFGLSTVQDKTEPVVRFLLELALNDLEWNNRHRITWGLGWGARHEVIKRVMDEILQRPMDSVFEAACAYLLYKETVKQEPAGFAWTAKIEQAYPDDMFAVPIQAGPSFEPEDADALRAEFMKIVPPDIAVEFADGAYSRESDKAAVYLTGEAQTKALESAIDQSSKFIRGNRRSVPMAEQLTRDAMGSGRNLTRFPPELRERLEAIAETYTVP